MKHLETSDSHENNAKHQIYEDYFLLDFAGRFLHNETGVFTNSRRQKPSSVREGRKEDQGDFNQRRFQFFKLIFRWTASTVSLSWEAKFPLDQTGPISLLSEQKRFLYEQKHEHWSSSIIFIQVKVLGHSLTKKNKWWAEKDKEKVKSWIYISNTNLVTRFLLGTAYEFEKKIF